MGGLGIFNNKWWGSQRTQGFFGENKSKIGFEMDSKKLYPLAALGYEFSIRVSIFFKKSQIEIQNFFYKRVKVVKKWSEIIFFKNSDTLDKTRVFWGLKRCRFIFFIVKRARLSSAAGCDYCCFWTRKKVNFMCILRINNCGKKQMWNKSCIVIEIPKIWKISPQRQPYSHLKKWVKRSLWPGSKQQWTVFPSNVKAWLGSDALKYIYWKIIQCWMRSAGDVVLR